MTTRRTAMQLGVLASWPFLTGFFWPPFFDLSWDEEVQLHDGRVIVVHLKFTYERLSRFSRYDQAILRNTEMSFDAGLPHGWVTQLFKRQTPVMLDQKEGQWYVALSERGDILVVKDENWGSIQNSSGLRIGMLKGSRFEPLPIDFLPTDLNRPNIDFHYGPLSQLVLYDGKRLTLEEKNNRLSRYPLGPNDKKFECPIPSVFQQDMNIKGANK